MATTEQKFLDYPGLEYYHQQNIETMDEKDVSVLDNSKSYTDSSVQAKGNELGTRIDNLILNAGDSSAECADARVTKDGTVHDTLKNRLDTEYSQLSSEIGDTKNNISYYADSGKKIIDITYEQGNIVGEEAVDTDSAYRVRTKGFYTTGNSLKVLVDLSQKSLRTTIMYFDENYNFVTNYADVLPEFVIDNSYPYFRFTIIDYKNGDWENPVTPDDVAKYYTVVENVTYLTETRESVEKANASIEELSQNLSALCVENESTKATLKFESVVYGSNNLGWCSNGMELFKDDGIIKSVKVVSHASCSTSFDGIISIGILTLDTSNVVKNFEIVKEHTSIGDCTLQTIELNIAVSKNQILLAKGVGFSTFEAINCYFSVEDFTVGDVAGTYEMQSPIEYEVCYGLKISKKSINGFEKRNNLFDGDSITHGIYSDESGTSSVACEKPYPLLVSEILGCDSTNIAIPGCGLTVQGCTNGDSTTSVLERSKTFDYSIYDLISISIGTNDYGNSVTIGSLEDTGEDTFYGALNSLLANIYTSNPYATVMFITPIFRHRVWKDDMNNTTLSSYENPNAGGYTLNEYCDAIVAVCDKYGIACLDIRKNNIANEFNYTQKIPDLLHPAKFVYVEYARKVSGFIKSHFCA